MPSVRRTRTVSRRRSSSGLTFLVRRTAVSVGNGRRIGWSDELVDEPGTAAHFADCDVEKISSSFSARCRRCVRHQDHVLRLIKFLYQIPS